MNIQWWFYLSRENNEIELNDNYRGFDLFYAFSAARARTRLRLHVCISNREYDLGFISIRRQIAMKSTNWPLWKWICPGKRGTIKLTHNRQLNIPDMILSYTQWPFHWKISNKAEHTFDCEEHVASMCIFQLSAPFFLCVFFALAVIACFARYEMSSWF